MLRDEHFSETPALREELKLVLLLQYDSLVLRIFPEKLLCDGRMLWTPAEEVYVLKVLNRGLPPSLRATVQLLVPLAWFLRA